MDDVRHMGNHAMYGMGQFELEVIRETPEVINSEYAWKKKFFGREMKIIAIVTDWVKDRKKGYKFSWAGFQCDINLKVRNLEEKEGKVALDIDVAYQPPSGIKGKILDKIIIGPYIKREVNKVYERCLNIVAKDQVKE